MKEIFHFSLCKMYKKHNLFLLYDSIRYNKSVTVVGLHENDHYYSNVNAQVISVVSVKKMKIGHFWLCDLIGDKIPITAAHLHWKIGSSYHYNVQLF